MKYYSEGLERWDFKLNEEEKIMQEIDRDLRTIYMPLRALDDMYPNEIDRNYRPEKQWPEKKAFQPDTSKKPNKSSAPDTRLVMENLKVLHNQGLLIFIFEN